MSNQPLNVEIRDVPDPEGGLRLELSVEGERIASASASADVLGDMHTLLGMDRDAVEAELREALTSLLKNQLSVSVSDPVEDPERPLRFTSSYKQRVRGGVRAGIVWYDVPSSTTGPEALPAIVRNSMRTAVHKKLTAGGSDARTIVDTAK